MINRLLLVLAVPILLTGCSNHPSLEFYHVNQDQNEVAKLKDILENEKSTNESLGVISDSELVVAVQVQPLLKFQKKKIEKRLKKKIKEDFPGYKVFVSSDLKIMWELEDLVEKDPNDKTFQKKLNKIKALAKEET